MKNFILLFLCTINIYALSISSNDNYQVFKADKYTITFTPQYQKEAIFIKENLDDFFKATDNSFGYRFDEPLRIVLISNNIQIANAFSTQVPYNMTAFFNGGTSMVDYFSTTSWLSTILTHELIHNYQLNAKKSEISQTLHKYLGNNFMPVWASIVPFFTLPNLMLPTGLLEGNSVLNESIYDNGGRLYNGRFQALVNELAFAGKITPTSFINDTLEFPYTESKYIVGGYYMKYLAELFGIDKVNSFFYNHSIHSINPFLLNETFYETFGVSYSTTLVSFVNYIKKQNKEYKKVENGKVLATSNSEIYLSKTENEILFLTQNLKSRPILNRYNFFDNKLDMIESKLKNGYLFDINGTLYSSAEGFISSKLYKQGLFDEEANILSLSEGKAVQDIKNGHLAYFKISESFDKPALYLDDQFIDYVASSALLDKTNNLYYFKQENNKRTLYKNKIPLFSFDGYSSKIVDVHYDSVYFIANTNNGSGLYKFENGSLFKITNYDNIISAKFIEQNRFLAVTINADAYKVIELNDPTITQIKTLPELNVIKNPANFTFKDPTPNATINSKNYNELAELQFSLLYPYYINDSQKGDTYSLSGLFIDPVMFNMLTLNYLKDPDGTLAGASYTNERYIPFEFTYYGVKDNTPSVHSRDFYSKLKIYGPLYKNDLRVVDVELSHYNDNNHKEKSPTTAVLKYSYNENYRLGSKPYMNYDIQGIMREDRDDKTQGFKISFNHHLFQDTYFDLNGKYLLSDRYNDYDQKGIELVENRFDLEKDLTNVLIEGLDYNFYVKSLQSAGIGFSSTFYISQYFPLFPVSIRKERLFGSYNSYNLKTYKDFTINEKIAGIEFDLLFFHKLSLPVTVKYIENHFAINDKKIVFELGTEF